MAERFRHGLHLLLLPAVVGGLWMYAVARQPLTAIKGTWWEGGVIKTGNPYGPPPAGFKETLARLQDDDKVRDTDNPIAQPTHPREVVSPMIANASG